MSSFRLISLLKLPSRPELYPVRTLLNGNKRLLCTEPSWTIHCEGRRSHYNHCRHSVCYYPSLLGKKCQPGSSIQFYRFNSQTSKGQLPTETKSEQPSSQPAEEVDELEKFKNLSLYQRIKAMYRDYWYVLGPVHIVTSIFFFGGFYYAASSGMDIIAILEQLHFSETVIEKLRDSSAGFIAIAYALYKIFTPVRYTVTLGTTTWAIRFLRERGLIKPRRPMKEAKEKMQSTLSAIKQRREKEKQGSK